MLLIFPPVAKPSEPPAGIAKLAGALKAHGISCRLLDMNVEGLLYLLNRPPAASDTWTRRAAKNISKNIIALRTPATFQSRDRYRRAVRDLGRVLDVSGADRGVNAGLADYQDPTLSPLRSSDLIAAAENPGGNLFYPYFKHRLPHMIEVTHKEREDKTDRAGKGFSVGFSLNYLSQALCTFSMIGFVKKQFPQIRIILGGGLITSWMKRPGWKNPFEGLVDQLVCGTGEVPLLSLFNVKQEMQEHYRPDYESLPLPDYFSPGFVLPYSASNGCYWRRCSFCPERAEENAYNPAPVEQAIADLDTLARTMKPSLVHLLDNAISPALLRALSQNQAAAPWYGFARISKELTDPDYCISLRRAGCVMLKLGLESGDQGVLDSTEKGIDLETASRVLHSLQKAGIAAYVYLLFGTPPETAVEARRTLDFVVRHHGVITFLNLAIFNLPICSREADQHVTEQFYEGDLSLYTGFQHPRGWDRKQVRLFLDNEFKRHAAVSSILRNDPPVFTSNHAAFFPFWPPKRSV